MYIYIYIYIHIYIYIPNGMCDIQQPNLKSETGKS